MFQKQQIETILKANGIPTTAPDEEIRSILLSARWDNNEVDTALMVLKENVIEKTNHVETIHKVFRSGDKLSPRDITSLLGINVSLDQFDIKKVNEKKLKLERIQTTAAIFLGLSIVLLGLTYLMYIEQAGLFHAAS